MISWITETSVAVLGLCLFVLMLLAAWLGSKFACWRSSLQTPSALSESQEGYVVTSIYTLVGLIIAFTFGMALDRYDTRRQLVLQDANAIEALYLSAQLLPEPHRARLSHLVVRYADHHVRLAQLRKEDSNAQRALAQDDALLRNLWTATIPAFESIRTIDFSTSFVDSGREVIQVDAMSKAARRAQIPGPVFGLLIVYSLLAAAALGYVMVGRRAELITACPLGLFVLAFMLLSDLNRPVTGWIRESQQPKETMLARLKANPPAVYFRTATETRHVRRP